jgi:hypothetical protein
MRFAALLPFGDPSKASHWDVWDTPPVVITREV